MKPRHVAAFFGGALLILLAAIVVSSTRRLPAPRPNAPGAFSFAALGDAPYQFPEGVQYRAVLADMAAHELSFVVHVGDIFGNACRDALYERAMSAFRTLPHPVLYTPGDNEWLDCGGRYSPLERLAHVRRTFFQNGAHSLGRAPLALTDQGTDSVHATYVENAVWTHRAVVLATVHIVGSMNGAHHDDPRVRQEAARRTAAAATWTASAFALARRTDARAVVLFFHGAGPFRVQQDPTGRAAFDPFLEVLEREAESFGRPVLLVHGDAHEYTVDRPLLSPATRDTIRNVTRLEVPGSPDVGWVRVMVNPHAQEPFSFEPRLMPRYKLW